MIIGIGIDLVDMRRIGAVRERHGMRFEQRLFTDSERRFCHGRADVIAAFARHYAFKEAASKALGTGFRQGVAWRDLELCREAGRKPFARFHGGALVRLGVLLPEGYDAEVHISISDEPPYATAQCLIEARRL